MHRKRKSYVGNLLLSPFVFTADLVFFLRGEVILNVESLPNLFRRFSFNHVCDSLAADIE